MISSGNGKSEITLDEEEDVDGDDVSVFGFFVS
jgi:hypothetical protein